MGAGSSSRSQVPWLVGVAAVVGMWWVAFEQGDRVPLLAYVNFGIHEVGHVAMYGQSELTTALAGSVAQVAVPLAIAGYFLLRGDWLGTGLCLAWAATSACEVATYVADAPRQELELIGGGRHDWAFILGPEGYAATNKSASIADQIRDGAGVAMVIGFALCLASPLRGRSHADDTADASRVTPASSA